MGGWENIQLCMDAKKFEVDEGYNRISIWYYKGQTRLRLNIYASMQKNENWPVKVYFISPNYPCSINCDGTINRVLVHAIERTTGLRLDLL